MPRVPILQFKFCNSSRNLCHQILNFRKILHESNFCIQNFVDNYFHNFFYISYYNYSNNYLNYLSHIIMFLCFHIFMFSFFHVFIFSCLYYLKFSFFYYLKFSRFYVFFSPGVLPGVVMFLRKCGRRHPFSTRYLLKAAATFKDSSSLVLELLLSALVVSPL